MWIRAPEFGVDFVKLVHSRTGSVRSTRRCLRRPTSSAAARVAVADRPRPRRGAVLVLERKIRDARSDVRLLHAAADPAPAWRRRLRRPGGARRCRRSSPSGQPDLSGRARRRSAGGADLSTVGRLAIRCTPIPTSPSAPVSIVRSCTASRATRLPASRSRALCGFSPTRIAALKCRFSGVVFPGDVLDFRVWRDKREATFQAFVGDRKALDQGRIAFGGDP